MAIYPGAVASNSDLHVGVNNKNTVLTSGIDASVTTIPVASTTGFPSTGFVTVDLEIIAYTSTNATNFLGATRGADGSTATTHANNSLVSHNIVAAHHNASKDEIIAVETALGANLVNVVTPTGTQSISGLKTFTNDVKINTGSLSLSRYQLVIGDISPVTINGEQLIVAQNITDAFDHNGIGVYNLYNNTGPGNLFSGYTSRIQVIGSANAVRCIGYDSSPENQSTGSVSSVIGYFASCTAGTGTTTLDVIKYAADDFDGAGTVNTQYGLFCFPLVKAGTNWALYIQGPNDSYINGHLQLTDGIVGAPAYTFFGDTDSGLYRIGANDIALATSGTKQLEITSAAVTTFLPTTIKGTTTNDNAATGNVGEYVSATAASVAFPATTTWGDLTSISLTAGDWDVSVMGAYLNNGATATDYFFGVSTTAGNSGTGLTTGDTVVGGVPTAAVNTGNAIAPVRFSLSGTTTVYLKYLATYSAGGPLASGRLSARRRR